MPVVLALLSVGSAVAGAVTSAQNRRAEEAAAAAEQAAADAEAARAAAAQARAAAGPAPAPSPSVPWVPLALVAAGAAYLYSMRR